MPPEGPHQRSSRPPAVDTSDVSSLGPMPTSVKLSGDPRFAPDMNRKPAAAAGHLTPVLASSVGDSVADV